MNVQRSVKISVIVPVYNTEKYIEKCLLSLINQTFTGMEIIVVNDGSPDGSKKIILQLQEEYPDRIIYLEKENGGLSDARNFGMNYAKGDYITFVDSDDYIDEDAYERMYHASENGTRNIIECDFWWEYPNKRKHDTAKKYKTLKEYLVYGRVIACNKLIRRDWINSLGIKFPQGLLYEDVGFFFSLMTHLNSLEDIAFIRQPFYHYVQRADSISYKESDRITDICWIYERVIRYLKDEQLWNHYRSEIEYKFMRNVLWGFPLRKVRFVKDKKIRKMLLDTMWHEVSDAIVDFKKNVYLEKISLANLYLKLITESMYMFLFMHI